MTGEHVDVLGQVSRLALQFGPFLFAVLVLLFITSKAGRYYREVCERQEPPAGEAEMRSSRFVYYLSWISGFVLVAVSVGWWLLQYSPQPRDYIGFRILRIQPDDELVMPRTSEVFVRKQIFDGLAEDGGATVRLEDYHFLVPVTRQPDEQGFLMIQYVNVPKDVDMDFTLDYEELEDRVFKVVVKDGRAILHDVRQSQDKKQNQGED